MTFYHSPRKLIDTGDDNKILLHELNWLSTKQNERLKAIREGLLNTSSIEIVLSRYNEDIEWADMYRNIIVLYDKSLNSAISPSYYHKYKRIPNVGRESYTFLYHIVHNYNRLANVTVFSQASAPTKGYEGHRKGGGHLMQNVSFHDYVLNPEGMFIFTVAIWIPSTAHIIRKGYTSSADDNNKIGGRFSLAKTNPFLPYPSCFDISTEKSLKFEFPINMITNIANRCFKDGAPYGCGGLNSYKNLVDIKKIPEDNIAYLAQGAIFSVTKENIRKRSLEYYKKLLAAAASNEDPSIGFLLEWYWYYVLTSDNMPCGKSNATAFDFTSFEKIYSTYDFRKRKMYHQQEHKPAS